MTPTGDPCCVHGTIKHIKEAFMFLITLFWLEENNHNHIFIPEGRERKNSYRKGHDYPGRIKKRRKSRERQTLTLREERRERRSIGSSFTGAEEQPGTSTGQVCQRSRSITPLKG